MDSPAAQVDYILAFGWPQIALLALLALGVWLLVSALVGRKRDPETGKKGGLRPRLRMRRGLSGAAVTAVGVALVAVAAMLQGYLGLTGETKAAHVIASRVEGRPHTMHLDLTLFDGHGAVASRKTYEFGGDRWALQADLVELEPWANLIGVRSGYKVTRLFGQFDDGSHTGEPDVLLDKDQAFFQSMREKTWWTQPFVRSAYGNAVVAAPGEYDVFVSRDAVKARPSGQ